jgi:hypothetical protein
MSNARSSFSPFVYFYVVLFFSILALLPVWVVFATDLRARLPLPYRLGSLIWLALVVGSYWYANLRCSTERLRYRNGLLSVAASMMAGTMYMSFFMVLPVLFVVFFGSVLIAFYGDIRGGPGYAPARWLRLIQYFHRNRMVQ